MCVRRDVCRVRSGLNQIIHESMLHVEGHSQSGCEWGVAGCCMGSPSVYCRECLQGQTGHSKTKQLGQNSAGEGRKEEIRW